MFLDLNDAQRKIPAIYRRFRNDWASIENLSRGEWSLFNKCAVAFFRADDDTIVFLSENLDTSIIFVSVGNGVAEITKSTDNGGYVVKFTDGDTKELRYATRTHDAYPDII